MKLAKQQQRYEKKKRQKKKNSSRNLTQEYMNGGECVQVCLRL